MRTARSLVGRDLARTRRQVPALAQALPALVIGLLLGAFLLASLRIDLIRTRYGLAAAMRDERALEEERRLLTAKLRELRDPTRLARVAADHGLARPERLIDLVSGPSGPAAPSALSPALPSPNGAPDRRP